MVPAILGTARLGNFRLGYVPAATEAIRQTVVRITVAGESVRYRRGSVTIRDVINDNPNTCTLIINKETPPTQSQRIRITINSSTPRLLFAGALETIRETYDLKPEQIAYHCTAQDDTPRANRRIPLGYWENISATTVAQELVAEFAPGFTTDHVQLGLPTITVHFEGSEAGMNGCLRQIAKLIGGYFYWEDRDLHLFTEEASEQPDDLDSTPGRFLDSPHISITRDDSQIRTRVYGKGHQEATLNEVDAGATMIPLGEVSMFNPAGGQVISESQILNYTGTQAGDGGGLVGPGAGPSAGPALALAAGSGVESGAHDYAVTFTTAAGESIAGPVTIITAGTVAAPTAAPTPASLSSGGSVDTGSHDYAATFVTATGETTPSPISGSITTGGTAGSPPTDPPTAGTQPAGTPTAGGNVTAGAHTYATTFVTALGETAAGPSSNSVTTGTVSAPSAPSGHTPSNTWLNVSSITRVSTTATVTTASAHGYQTGDTIRHIGADQSQYNTTAVITVTGSTTYTFTVTGSPATPATGTITAGGSAGSLTAGAYKYQVTFVNAAIVDGEPVGGETSPSSASSTVTITPVNEGGGVVDNGLQGTTGGSLIEGKHYSYFMTFVDAAGETVPFGTAEHDLTSGNSAIILNTLAVSSDSRVTARKIYRVRGDIGDPKKLVTTITNNNAGVSFTDTVAEGSLGADAPSANTTGTGRIAVTIATSSDPTVTSRKIYRTAVNGSLYTLLTTVSGNATTIYTDNTPDSSLGADAPSSNTATVQTVRLAEIQRGPSGTTARKVYRTAAGGSQLKLLTTIENNTTTTYTDTIADGSLGANVPTGVTLSTVNLTGIMTGGPAVTARKLYRRFSGTGTLKLVTTIADNVTTTYTDTTANASLGADAPSSNTATANQVALSSLPLGGATVTGRKVYRTAADGSQLKLLTTIANNTTTTYTDSTADASLGANVPTADTSGLAQPEGQIAAGATSLIVANTAAFSASGGWAVIGNGRLVIRYTGLTGSTLTGIPASGTGSIVASIAYNSTVTAAPTLTGVTGLVRPLIKGAPIHIWVQRDDVSAQQALAVREDEGGDGIIEYRIVDERRGEASLIALCDADLAQFSREIVTGVYASRDVKTKSGKPIVIDLPSPEINETLTIQDVTITEIDIAPRLAPKFTVTASSMRFSLEDLLRRMAASLEGV